MYAAPSTTPLAAKPAQILFATNTPWRMRSSPMKPFNAGRPIDDIVMIRKMTA